MFTRLPESSSHPPPAGSSNPVFPSRLYRSLLTTRPNRQDGHTGTTRSRRSVAETGSFGKSTRRSRSRTGTPARSRENPTLAAADKLFGDWVSNQTAASANAAPAAQRKTSNMMQEELVVPQGKAKSTPVEVILRGYRSADQQYAAIAHYESLAGSILEDYPRDPPASQRRYKSELRDPAFTRRRALTPEEKTLVNRAAGGEHWVKVTFESAEAADSAIFASPQRVHGYLVVAEFYRNGPPVADEPCPDPEVLSVDMRSNSMPALNTPRGKASSGFPSSFTSRLLELSSPGSHASSQTMDTGTLSHPSSATISRAGIISPSEPSAISGQDYTVIPPEREMYCSRIPTARKANLLPAEQALLPQQSVMQRTLNAIPLVRWFGSSMIGNEVPRNDAGDFDWNRASLYWKLVWWLDATFGLFKGDVCSSVDKED
ncbi:Nucleoporin NUP53 [Paramyrothecium foliicola]|nr:Nucleoporin NUP53 [Paramyrothecium foliicola]